LGKPAHRVTAVCTRYVELAVAQADLRTVTTLAIDETSRARGHDYITLAADAQARRVVFVTEGRDAGTIEQLAEPCRRTAARPRRSSR
jgi:transposase